MEEFENYYVIKHGVRWTGMPSWKNELTDQEIWALVTFLNQKKKPGGSAPAMTMGQSPHGPNEKGGKK